MVKILIIDDDPTIRMVLKRALQNQGYTVTVASSGEEGIAQAQQIHPALIVCDWMMSPINGLDVCRCLKANSKLSTTFFILLTARGEVEDRVIGLDAGADDFLAKPIDINELKARVRAGLRLYQLNQDLQHQKQVLEALNQDLQHQKQLLETELADAGSYVRSLLPAPLTGTVTTETLFIPSAQLGGDSFDYYWIDDDHLVLYLLDVSGHGVGSALLSVSVLNLLRSQSLPNTNFCQPSEVLKSLNYAFQMSEHDDKYFTIWYGVYDRCRHQISYASAGHPPAILLVGDTTTQVQQLGSPGLPIGFLPDADFENESVYLQQRSTLYIFSDGAYEISQPNGSILGKEAFVQLLADSHQQHNHLKQLLNYLQNLNQGSNFEDDLSLLKIQFNLSALNPEL
ncbi:SpoIIE family protein phosphatase [Gloeocapsopsis crepidinum LEGE 06123]|uniref:SpoIIE family protein phosphatase n=1 Tax=Gloeocapsopsis crepidinum LEGE 06123 TaxID=588587 RepID=A0ABR9UQ83_9CHRO|nr:SpoIIE family protein phosphatase [Gloeocapsopsis crepidinum]MBE9190443.1 SpoIIE family protein phosphatase [Gloeocapsopsis crepidinum LEGE 06123]